MKRNSALLALVLFSVAILVLAAPAQAYFEFNQQGDNETDAFGYYYVITGGKFPTGNIPNGDNASGGTIRYLFDDPFWGPTIDLWQKDDWFSDNASFALTLKDGDSIVYDNNGIEDGSYGDYYDGNGSHGIHGLYRGYSMANNFDWIYAGYFKLTQTTTFDQLIGYFDPNGGSADPFPFNPNSPGIAYRMNIWSAIGVAPNYMPAVTSFTGDVFSTDEAAGVFSVSDTGVDRVFPGNNPPPEDIWRLTFKLAEPVTLPAGVYFFSHDAVILEEIVIGDCNTGVTLFPSDAQGLSESLDECASGVKNHGQYLKCVSKVLGDAMKAGVITGAQKGAIESCAAQSDIGKK